MSEAIVDMAKVHTEVPDSLRQLARYVSRVFYGPEYGIVVDLLVRSLVLSEDQIREYMRLDVKQVRQMLIVLRTDKIVRERLKEVERPGQKPLKFNYYFISYRGLINVFNYKATHIRKKLEDQEKQASFKAFYKCSGPSCSKTYTDLDVGQLWRGLEMICTWCESPVIEDVSALPDKNTRSLVAKFNEQMIRFFDLFRQCDGIQLANTITEPTFKLENETSDAAGADGDPNRDHYSIGGRAIHDIGKKYSQDVKVNIGEEGASDTAQVKAVPLWLQSHTDPSTSTKTEFLQEPKVEAGGVGSGGFALESREIELILAHEKSKPVAAAASHGPESAESDDEFEEVEQDVKVYVGGKEMSLLEVTPEMVQNEMSASEKEHYNRIAQETFANLYD